VAVCLFDDFHREREYLDRTIAFFQAKAGLRMSNPVRFGGTGNVLYPSTARHGALLFAGEAAGFQDALWGFGMRLAMLSGHLAARVLVAGHPREYDGLWRRRFGAQLRVSIVNRYAFSKMADRGYVRLMRSIAKSADARQWLRHHYASSLCKRLVFPLARRQTRSRRDPPGCALSGCDCTWCRSHPHSRPEMLERGQRRVRRLSLTPQKRSMPDRPPVPFDAVPILAPLSARTAPRSPLSVSSPPSKRGRNDLSTREIPPSGSTFSSSDASRSSKRARSAT
jgi:hypothetical protein